MRAVGTIVKSLLAVGLVATASMALAADVNLVSSVVPMTQVQVSAAVEALADALVVAINAAVTDVDAQGLTGDEAAALIAAAIVAAVPEGTPADVSSQAIDRAIAKLGPLATAEVLQAAAAAKAELAEAAAAATGGAGAPVVPDPSGPPAGGAGEDEGDDPGYVQP